jgi:uncharacterized LabA/DUF88 family protein
MPDAAEQRLAVLIDADNAPRTALKEVMEEIAVYGTPTIKRIYGDWTAPNMNSWKPLLLESAVTPIQQYAYTTGKNATDSAMIIDAMDILYTAQVDGFVLISSDSDFTRLATRLREAGKKVYGMGEKKTPQPFIASCDKFIYIEIIRDAAKESEQHAQKKAAPQNSGGGNIPKKTIRLLASSLQDIADDEGFGHLGALGDLLSKKQPDFDSRNYGYSKLSNMIRAIDRFEIRKDGNVLSVRDKLARG